MNDYTKWHQSQPDIGLDEAIERIEGGGRMKAILVMDMPEKCLDCYMCYFSPDEDDLVCADTKFPIETFMGVRPDRCPLVPMPERENTTSAYRLRKFAEEKGIPGPQAVGWKRGWNACLDAIMGGDEDD